MIALILKGYPRLSETFIAQEILALERRGVKILIVSLRHPTDVKRHPIHEEIRSPVLYLPEYLRDEPLRVMKGVFAAIGRRGFWQALKSWLRDLKRDFSSNRARRFGQALVLARELPAETTALYTHFIHTPGSVGRYCSLLNGLPWVGSAHAKDIWTQSEWELRDKLADISWLVTCTRANRDYLASLAPDDGRVDLVYHGLDFSRFSTPEVRDRSLNDGINQPVKLISVGRAVEKKGYNLLIDALAMMPKELDWSLTHIGGGPLLGELKAQAEKLGLDNRITWMGAMAQSEVLKHYRESDLFVLPSRITDDGDRDGLPNVLMEAQSQGLCCLATSVSGIPELIIDGETGVLVEQNDSAALARELERLIRSPKVRQSLAEAGYEHVRSQFSFEHGIDRLMDKFNEQNLLPEQEASTA
ncbi:Glycosyl transferase, group 1 family protein [Marinobacterium lacunae]|uniref:Glycosyl transferase, group 1 family protein n=1 Tax=Marinobacterium lacunae TaxID=1232683 RepID=A0A081FUY3_9GAMM|nr:glycosyltransferase family 4 protein [Marinobacterium lacunae]KEA62338.1 Glycosyl transferase, group 1 family protein [Marinobacterium lacunae]